MPRGGLRDDGMNVDRRLTRVEQMLPIVATKADVETAISAAVAPLATRAELEEKLAAVIAPLATRAELEQKLAAAIAPLATKAELEEKLAAVIAPLATKAELAAAIAPLATKGELREEARRTRHRVEVLIEAVRDDVRIFVEGLVAAQHRTEAVRGELQGTVTELDGRVTRLEAWLATRKR